MLCCAVCSCSAPAGYTHPHQSAEPGSCNHRCFGLVPGLSPAADGFAVTAAACCACVVPVLCRSEVDPEQAVALGAAIQAAVLLGLSSGVELMDGSYVEEFHNRSTGF